MKQNKLSVLLLISLLSIFLIACSSRSEEITFQANSSQKNPTRENYSLPFIEWTNVEYSPSTPDLPIAGALTLPLNIPLYTLRTEGVGTDFQETGAFKNFLYQSLLDYQSLKESYIPVLAQKWSYTPGQKEPIYFEINPHATWSDGSPVRAEDVVATFEFLKNNDLEQKEKTDFFQEVQATALNDQLLRVEMKTTDQTSFFRLTQQAIYPAKELSLYTAKTYLNSLNDQPLMGSGPYFLDTENSSKEKELNFLHKENYWGRDVPALKNLYNFQKITYRIIPDEKAREWSFREGILDVLVVTNSKSWLEDWSILDEPFMARGFWQKKKVINASPKGVLGVAFNLRRPVLKDVRLRQALSHLWDRESIMETFFLGEYFPTNSFYPRAPYTNTRNTTYGYNLERAKTLLGNMGYQQAKEDHLLRDESGKTLDLELLITPQEMPYFHQFNADAKKLGINLKVTILPNNALQLRLINHDFDLAYTGFRGVLFPRPDLQFHSSLVDNKNSLNIWGLEDEKIDKLIGNFSDLSPKEQEQTLRELDYLLSEKIIFYLFLAHELF